LHPVAAEGRNEGTKDGRRRRRRARRQEKRRGGRASLSSVREIETLEEIFMVKNRESRES
jgi:hypothetical protein